MVLTVVFSRRGITARLILGPALSIAIDFVIQIAAEVVGFGLTMVIEIWAASGILIFAAALGLIFVKNVSSNAAERNVIGHVIEVDLTCITAISTNTAEFGVLACLVVTIFILVGVRSSRSISMSEIIIRKALILAVGFIIIAAPIVAVENSISSGIVVGVIWVVVFSSATVLVVKGAAVTLKNAFIRVISLAFHVAWEALVTTLCVVLINFHLNIFNSDL